MQKSLKLSLRATPRRRDAGSLQQTPRPGRIVDLKERPDNYPWIFLLFITHAVRLGLYTTVQFYSEIPSTLQWHYLPE